MRLILATALIMAPLAAQAGVGIQGTYRTKEACEWSKLPNSQQSTPESVDYMFLDNKGIHGWEWDCEFLASWRASNGDVSIVAACADGPDAWTDTYTMRKYVDGYRLMEKTPKGTINVLKYPVRCK